MTFTDNWDICPKCLDGARKKAAAARDAVYADYGKVSAAEFDRRRDALVKEVEPEDYRTFREDYEFYGADEGEVTASYGGSCKTCGLKVSLTASKRFWPEVSP